MSILPRETRWTTGKRCFAYCGPERCDCEANPNHPSWRAMAEEAVERAHDRAASEPPARSFADGTETRWHDEYGRECG